MISTTLRQHRTSLQKTAKSPKQSKAHTLAAILGRSNPNALPISLAPVNILTLEEIEAKYGSITQEPQR